jgi:hypothetical protein
MKPELDAEYQVRLAEVRRAPVVVGDRRLIKAVEQLRAGERPHQGNKEALRRKRQEAKRMGYFEQTRHDETLRIPCARFCGKDECCGGCMTRTR